MDTVEIRDKIENLQNNMDGLTALVHTFLEGLRSDSVSPEEIIHATTALYLLTEMIAERMEGVKKDLASIS